MKVDIDYYKNLGSRLAKIREKKGLSQRKIAEVLGVTFQQYQKYESGVNRIPANSLVIFCDITNSDLREVAGIPIADYEKASKEHIIKHTHYTTYVNNFNGLFSNLFNMDLKLMKNKIAVAAVLIGVLLFFIIELLKFFPAVYNIHHANFLSYQFLIFMVTLSIITFVVFSYSLLTYLVSFIAATGIYGNLHRLIFPEITKLNDPVLGRVVMYLVAAILVFIIFFVLKKLKVNLISDENKDNHKVIRNRY